MFRQISTVVVVVLVALGSVAAATAAEPKEVGGKAKNPPKEIAVDLGSGVKLKMVLIPAGEFKMGSGESAEATAAFFNKIYGENRVQAHRFKDEHPQHRVRITKPFYLGTYHVTRGQFRQFANDSGYKTGAEKEEPNFARRLGHEKNGLDSSENNSWRDVGFEQTDEHPVVCISWSDALTFCNWLSQKEGKTYRLPTEAEWEYACRAGTTTRYHSGDDPETLAKVGNVAIHTLRLIAGARPVLTSPVGSFKPNAFGLYDMHGNAWQWCSDWYDDTYYTVSPVDNPTGPDSGAMRVLRGGSWGSRPDFARSTSRYLREPSSHSNAIGFRVARTQ